MCFVKVEFSTFFDWEGCTEIEGNRITVELDIIVQKKNFKVWIISF